MYCRMCGKEINNNDLKCPYCKTQVAIDINAYVIKKYCINCGEKITDLNSICLNCNNTKNLNDMKKKTKNIINIKNINEPKIKKHINDTDSSRYVISGLIIFIFFLLFLIVLIKINI